MTNSRKVLLIGIGALVLLFLVFSGKMVENVDNGEIVIIQSVAGNVTIYDQAGPQFQGFGNATHYKKSNQFWFSNKKDEGSTENEAIKIRFNDGGHALISGSVRWYMPKDKAAIMKLHTDFGSQEAIEMQLIRQTVTKSVYMTGPLMSSKESSSEKRNDLLSYIEDQAINGVYKTEQKEVKIHDDLMNLDKTITQVKIVEKNGAPIRQETSVVKTYSIPMSGLALNSIDYDEMVEKQIQVQQQTYMQVQTAIANSKKAEQDAITVELQGKAAAAKAKWDQEVIKATNVTEAESNLAVQVLSTKQAELYKKQQILEGEGEAAKQKLMLQANGALEQKLATYEKVNQFWADAFSKYGGNITPTYYTGGGTVSNGATDFMSIMAAKAAKDLALDLSNKK